MATLKSLFDKQQLGFTSYNPDCTQSRLWGNLDQAIHEATGFRVLHRHWIVHDINSLMRFYGDGTDEPPEQDPDEGARKYDNVPPEELKHGHLFGKLMLSGPSLLTFWQGDNVTETLFQLKGKTHPAEAASDTIRGRFWCDNAICNLLHVSDNHEEAERELGAIRVTGLMAQEAVPIKLLDASPPVASQIGHSGLLVVCELLSRVLMTMDRKAIRIDLPPSGSARETNQVLTSLLQEASSRLAGTAIARFIDAYIAGDLITVTHMMKAMPLTRWEHFVVQCGACTRDGWNGVQ